MPAICLLSREASLENRQKYFFLSLSGRKCGANHTIFRWFRLILKDAGIPFTGNHHGPRIHDLRHTFSLYAMER